MRLSFLIRKGFIMVNIIIYTLLCIVFTALVITSFSLIHKKGVKENWLKYSVFLLYVVFSYYTLYLSLDILVIIVLFPLIYVILDDMFNLSFNILFPMASLLLLLVLDFNFNHLLSSFIIFGILMVLSLLSKEKIIGSGDVYFLLPIAYLTNLEQIYITIILASVLGLIFRIGVLIYQKLTNKKITEIPFSPFIFISFNMAICPLFF